MIAGALFLASRFAGAQSPDQTTINPPQLPGSRLIPLMVYDTTRDRLLVYGGVLALPRAPGVNHRDPDPRTIAWDGQQWSVVAQSGPVSRDEMAYGVDPRDGSVVMFGGRGNGAATSREDMRVAFRETWRFAGNTWTLVDTTGPEGRSSPQGAFDEARGVLVVFGGAQGHAGGRGALATDTWEWDGRGWKRLDVPGPPGRTGHVMAWDPVAKHVIMHGGVRSVDRVALTDTWAWNGQQWRLLTMEGPRTIFGAATSAPDSGIVVFGGHRLSGESSAATWQWTGKEWRTIATTGPSARTFPALATDRRRGRIYLLGGAPQDASNAQLTDFWQFESGRGWLKVSAP